MGPRDNYRRILHGISLGIHGVATCPEHSNPTNHEEKWHNFARFPMGHLLPIPNHFATIFTDFNILANKIEKARDSGIPWLGDEVVDSFCPSRLPPRVAIKLPGAMAAVGKEIDDLSAPRGAEPPCRVEVGLRDSRFPPIPKAETR